MSKKIHQIWYSAKNAPMPEYFNDFIDSWKEFNPDYEHILWRKEEVDLFLNSSLSEFPFLFELYLLEIQKIDILKYLILYEFGGIYVDVDYECLKPISSIVPSNDCCLVQESEVPFVLGNAFIAAPAKHDFITELLKSLSETLNNDEHNKKDLINFVLNSTGPGMITSFYNAYSSKSQVQIIPGSLLSPITATDSRSIFQSGSVPESIIGKLSNAFAVHYFFSIWLNE